MEFVNMIDGVYIASSIYRMELKTLGFDGKNVEKKILEKELETLKTYQQDFVDYNGYRSNSLIWAIEIREKVLEQLK